jgi:hypothetical protein
VGIDVRRGGYIGMAQALADQDQTLAALEHHRGVEVPWRRPSFSPTRWSPHPGSRPATSAAAYLTLGRT